MHDLEAVTLKSNNELLQPTPGPSFSGGAVDYWSSSTVRSAPADSVGLPVCELYDGGSAQSGQPQETDAEGLTRVAYLGGRAGGAGAGADSSQPVADAPPQYEIVPEEPRESADARRERINAMAEQIMRDGKFSDAIRTSLLDDLNRGGYPELVRTVQDLNRRVTELSRGRPRHLHVRVGCSQGRTDENGVRPIEVWIGNAANVDRADVIRFKAQQ